ncbi:hypothetical protein BDV37DRAFT_242865, partial [Aspergillus pseudonomiae]
MKKQRKHNSKTMKEEKKRKDRRRGKRPGKSKVKITDQLAHVEVKSTPTARSQQPSRRTVSEAPWLTQMPMNRPLKMPQFHQMTRRRLR